MKVTITTLLMGVISPADARFPTGCRPFYRQVKVHFWPAVLRRAFLWRGLLWSMLALAIHAVGLAADQGLRRLVRRA